jgi:hypothetical protein
MIKYKLVCKNCNLLFDSWFASSKEYESLNCHICNSTKIEKTLMAPKLLKRSKNKIYDINSLKFREINNKIKEYQRFIKNNFDYVGENFVYEARSIHYNNKKINKGIYFLEDLN